jgi:hypothetical protein
VSREQAYTSGGSTKSTSFLKLFAAFSNRPNAPLSSLGKAAAPPRMRLAVPATAAISPSLGEGDQRAEPHLIYRGDEKPSHRRTISCDPREHAANSLASRFLPKCRHKALDRTVFCVTLLNLDQHLEHLKMFDPHREPGERGNRPRSGNYNRGSKDHADRATFHD